MYPCTSRRPGGIQLPDRTVPVPTIAALSPGLTGMQFTPAKLIEMRETVRGMFTHGYDSYLKLRISSRRAEASLEKLGRLPERAGEFAASACEVQRCRTHHDRLAIDVSRPGK